MGQGAEGDAKIETRHRTVISLFCIILVHYIVKFLSTSLCCPLAIYLRTTLRITEDIFLL